MGVYVCVFLAWIWRYFIYLCYICSSECWQHLSYSINCTLTYWKWSKVDFQVGFPSTGSSLAWFCSPVKEGLGLGLLPLVNKLASYLPLPLVLWAITWLFITNITATPTKEGLVSYPANLLWTFWFIVGASKPGILIGYGTIAIVLAGLHLGSQIQLLNYDSQHC